MAKILIVDDEADMRTVLFHTLRAAGHTVTEAPDGETALKKLKRTRFDLVVLDIMMPKMSGYEVLDKMRAMPAKAQAPVIVVTAKHEPSGLKREVAAGAADHIAKPFLPSELEAAVERVLTSHRDDVVERRGKLADAAEIYDAMGELRRGIDE
jgi:CheY-like chemotaxis protein